MATHTADDDESREGEVQAAVIGALSVFCDRENKHFVFETPYSNQQGDAMRQYCADLVAVLGQSLTILLELKYLNSSTGSLPRFDAVQFAEILKLSKLGLPVGYAYNNVDELEYHDPDRKSNWPVTTLNQINRSPPQELPHGSPSVAEHETLYSWLDKAMAGNSGAPQAEIFGKIIGTSLRPKILTNGVLTLLYGVRTETLYALKPDDLTKVYNYLKKHPRLKPLHERTIKKILGSADAFESFLARNSPPKKRTPRGP